MFNILFHVGLQSEADPQKERFLLIIQQSNSCYISVCLLLFLDVIMNSKNKDSMNSV